MQPDFGWYEDIGFPMALSLVGSVNDWGGKIVCEYLLFGRWVERKQ